MIIAGFKPFHGVRVLPLSPLLCVYGCNSACQPLNEKMNELSIYVLSYLFQFPMAQRKNKHLQR